MTIQDFNLLADKIFEECNEIMQTKGVDYTPNQDRLSCFKEEAEALGITPQQALWSKVYKHLMSVQKYIKTQELKGEGIELKLKDLINYCVLFIALEKDLNS